MDANELLAKLRESRFAWAIYIPVTVLLNVASTLSGSCLASVMVGIVTFGIPFLLGAKGLGTLLKSGTLILVLSGIVLGTLVTHFLYNQEFIFEERILDGTDLEDGIVTPYLGDENTVFNFTVTYTGVDSPENITLYLNITELSSEEETSHVLNGSGDIYYHNTTLSSDIYNYKFAVFSNVTGGWNETDTGLGPVTAPISETMVQQWMWGILVMFIPGGLFFYMIVLLYNSRRKAREEQRTLAEEEREWTSREKKEEGEEKEEEKEETAQVKGDYECTECGADVPEDAVVCPKCGEPFEEEGEHKEMAELKEEETEEFECTECGADVPGDAAVCPSCGESFDDEEESAGKFMCTKCGADVAGDTDTCPSCGESFGGEEEKGG